MALDADQVAIGLWCLTFAARGDVECSLPMCKTKHVAFMKQRAAITKPTNVIHRAMCNHAQSKSSMIPCLTSIAKSAYGIHKAMCNLSVRTKAGLCQTLQVTVRIR